MANLAMGDVIALIKALGGKKATQSGYFFNGKFYKDAQHTEEITPKEGMLYIDSGAHKLYVYDSGAYVPVAGGATTGASVFEGYGEMVESINAMSSAELQLGGNVYVFIENPLDPSIWNPDLWIARINSTSIPYTYTTDDALKADLLANKSIRVGYYTLAVLEGGADLANYYNKQQADATFKKSADMLEEATITLYEVGSNTPHTYKTYIEAQ